MPNLNFDDDYKPGIWTGQALHDRLELTGATELILTILAVTRRLFDDAAEPEWVLNFGETEPEYRLRKKQYHVGAALRAEFGSNGNAWVGRQIVLTPRFVQWTDRETGEHKEGYTIDIKPIPGNPYAAASDGSHPVAASPPAVRNDFGDEIPF